MNQAGEMVDSEVPVNRILLFIITIILINKLKLIFNYIHITDSIAIQTKIFFILK